jgi:flagellar biosynthesis GTPase FlhF
MSAQTYSVANSGSSAYLIDNITNLTINLVRGNQYIFNINVNVSGHLFWIQTSTGSYNSANIYSTGITNNGIHFGDLTFDVPLDAPNTLYYVCQYHSSMRGVINITSAEPEQEHEPEPEQEQEEEQEQEQEEEQEHEPEPEPEPEHEPEQEEEPEPEHEPEHEQEEEQEPEHEPEHEQEEEQEEEQEHEPEPEPENTRQINVLFNHTTDAAAQLFQEFATTINFNKSLPNDPTTNEVVRYNRAPPEPVHTQARIYSMRSLFTNNAQVYYKHHSLPAGGRGSVRMSRYKQHRM